MRARQRVEYGGDDRDVRREARQTRPEGEQNRQQHVGEREESHGSQAVVAEPVGGEHRVTRVVSEIDRRGGVCECGIAEERAEGMQQRGERRYHEIGRIDADRPSGKVTPGIERRAAFGVQRREKRIGEQKDREREEEAEAPGSCRRGRGPPPPARLPGNR